MVKKNDEEPIYNGGNGGQPPAEGGVQVQSEGGLEEVITEGEKAHGFFNKVSGFFKSATCARPGYEQVKLDPISTKKKITDLDNKISVIGLDERVNNLPSYLKGPLVYLSQKLGKLGDDKILIAEDEFLEIKEAAEAVLSEISMNLSDAKVVDGLPKGLYGLHCEYEARMIEGAKSGIEAEELGKEAYSERERLRGGVKKLSLHDHAKKAEIYKLIAEYQSNLHNLNLQQMNDKKDFVTYEAMHLRVGTQIDVMQGLYDLMMNKIMTAVSEFYKRSTIGTENIEDQVTTVGSVMAEMFGRLNEYINLSDQKITLTEQKIQRLGEMKTDYEAKVGASSSEGLQSALGNIAKQQQPVTDDIATRMREVASGYQATTTQQ